jgi:tetratricopeptide (TPR) repeat protein
VQQVTELTHQAHDYLRLKKPKLAVAEFRKVLVLDPDNVDARGNLGVLLFFQASYPEAITQLRAALKQQPDLWNLQVLLGMAEKRTGDLESATRDLDIASPHLTDKKIQIEAGLELIEAESSVGQFEKAASVVANLQALAPGDPHILSVAYEIYSQLCDQTLLSLMIIAPHSAEMHIMMANQLFRQGEITKAIAQYRAAILLNPHLPGEHFELAELLRNSFTPGLQAQAQGEYQAALAVNPYDEKAWRGLGDLSYQKREIKAAERDYGRALALQPDDSEAQAGMAIVLISLNEQPQAMALLESAVKNDPTNIRAHYRLSTLYRQVGRTADANREMDVYLHYHQIRAELGVVFQQLRAPSPLATATPAAKK